MWQVTEIVTMLYSLISYFQKKQDKAVDILHLALKSDLFSLSPNYGILSIL